MTDLQRFYGTCTKKNLLWKANMVKERFNNANFKAKRSGWKQKINRIEVVDHGTAVYIPMYADYIGDLIGLGKYLGWR